MNVLSRKFRDQGLGLPKFGAQIWDPAERRTEADCCLGLVPLGFRLGGTQGNGCLKATGAPESLDLGVCQAKLLLKELSGSQ